MSALLVARVLGRDLDRPQRTVERYLYDVARAPADVDLDLLTVALHAEHFTDSDRLERGSRRELAKPPGNLVRGARTPLAELLVKPPQLELIVDRHLDERRPQSD